MKKKFVTIFLFCLVMFGVFTVSANAAGTRASGTCGTNLTWTLYNNGELTISGTGAMTEFASQYTWDHGAPWLSYKDYVFEVTVDDGVTSIGSYAFYGYTNLESVALPGSVTSIGKNAFYDCTGLTDITLSSIKSIGDGAFNRCAGLQSVTISKSLKSIGSTAFYGCTGLTGVYISDLAAWCEIQFKTSNSNPLACAHKLYLNNELLTSVTIPGSVTGIGDYMFEGCNSLQSITIPDSVTSIGSSTFYECRGLESITIPDSVTSIGSGAFHYCTGLKSVTIGSGVTSIGDGAFNRCAGLQSVTIPKNVKSIGNNAFYYCSGLKSITIGSGVESIGAGALSYCKGLTDVTVPNSVQSIGADAFRDCTGLKSITIGSGVKSIGKSAVYGCTSLTGINISDLAAWCGIEQGDILNYAKNLYINGKLATTITIPSSVGHINKYAFKGCTSLTHITIPESVREIGEQAFVSCSNLRSITLGSGVTSIGNYAFSGCTALTDVYYAGNQWYKIIGSYNTDLNKARVHYVSSISDVFTMTLEEPENGTASISKIAALKDDTVSVTCSPLIGYGIDAITVDGKRIEGDSFTVTGDHTVCVTFKKVVDADIGGSCGKNVFWALDPADVLHIYGAGAMTSNPWSTYAAQITAVDIGDSVTGIGSDAFKGCTELTGITIPNSVTSIGNDAFSGCTGLTGITIPDSVTSIGSYAFYNCTALKSVKLGSSVEKLDGSVFRDCKSLESITIPNSVTSIHNIVFSGCTALKSVKLGSGVTSIDSMTFNNCTALTSFTVDASNPSYANDEYGVLYNKNKTTLVRYPAGNTRASYAIKSGVTSIGDYAFYGCTVLTGVTIPDSVESIGAAAFYGCKKLQSIAIPEGVSVINSSVFSNCTELKSVIIADGVGSIGNSAFSECRSLKDVCFIGREKLWQLVAIGSDNTYLTNATMHYISSIGDICMITLAEAENGTPSLSNYAVTEGESVTVSWRPAVGYDIGEIFVDGVKLDGTSFSVTGNHTVQVTFKKIAEASIGGSCGTTNVFWALDTDNVLHVYGTGAIPTYGSGSSNLTPWWGYRSKITGAVIGDGVTSIGSYAFYCCAKLTSVTLPGSLTSISSNAFSGCTGLSEVRYFGSSEQLAKLQVNDRNLPDKRLWKGAGGSCGENLSWELTASGELLINGQGAMTDFVSAAAVPWNPYLDRIQSVTIGEQITHIGSYAFQDCKIGPDLDFSPALQSIGAQAFSGCTTLKTILLKSKLSSIGSGAFAGSGLYLIILDNESLLPVSVASDALPARIGWGVHKMSIYTAEQLAAIGTDPSYGLDRSYILMADIDLEGEDWKPIGDAAHPFTGEFDGNGHTIGNLTIRIPFDYTGDPLLGLFGHVSGEDASIQNLTLTNVSLSVPSCYVMTDASVGALVGRVDSEGALPVISNCSVSGKIEVSMRQGDYNAPYGYYKDYNANAYIGGLIGSGRCRIENCTNLATVTADYTNHKLYVGGIIGRGESKTEIVRCRNLAVIRAKHGPTDVGCGGIAGFMDYNTMLDQCVNHSTVSIQNSSINVTSERLYAGGIAGYATTQITNCYNDASVYCGDTRNINYYGYGGGIVGLLGGDPDGQSFYQPSVKCCYTMGSGIQLVTAGLYGACVGGIAGLAGSATDTVVRGMEFQKCATALMGAGARLSVVQCSTYGTNGPRLTKYVAAITSGNCTMSNCYYYCPNLSEYFTVGSGVYSGSISSKSVFTALAWDTQNAWYWEADSGTYGRPHLQIEEDTPTFVVGYDGSNLTLRAVLYDGGEPMNILAAAYSADGKLLRTELLGNIIRGNLSYDAETLIYKAPFKLGQTDHVKFFFTDRNDRPIMLPYFQ